MRRVTVLLLSMLLMLSASLVPAAAQGRDSAIPRPDLLEFAGSVPSTAAMYVAVRLDAGFVEQTDALLRRLEPLIGPSDFDEMLRDFFGEEELRDVFGGWLAVALMSPEIDFDDLLDEDGMPLVAFDVDDIGTVREFLAESEIPPLETRGGWETYGVEDEILILLNEEMIIVSPDTEIMAQILSGDFGALSNDARFRATLERLPQPGYDFVAYLDLTAAVSARLAETRGRLPRLQAANAFAEALGTAALAGVNVGGRDLLLDAAWHFGDTTDFAALGFDPAFLGGPVIDPNFASHAPADTQFYLQSANFGSSIIMIFDAMNALGHLISESPSAANFFGLGPGSDPNVGTMLRGWAGFGFAAATGLNLERDVIRALDGDFALHASIIPIEGPLEFAPSLALILNESGMGGRYLSAAATTLDRAGLPITRVPQERGGGEAIDLSVVTDSFMMSMDPLAGDDPNFDVWLGANDEIIAFGTAPAVQFALDPQADSLATTPAYHRAVESTILPNAQALMFLNFEGLLGLWEPDAQFDLIEGVTASAVADSGGLTGRIAVSLK